jgi:hypothetical protein
MPPAFKAQTPKLQAQANAEPPSVARKLIYIKPAARSIFFFFMAVYTDASSDSRKKATLPK